MYSAAIERMKRRRRRRQRRRGYREEFLLCHKRHRRKNAANDFVIEGEGGRPMPRYGSIVSPYEDWYVQREIPNEEEMSVVPDAPAPPSLTKEYIERELNFLPEAFRRSMYRRSIHLRSGKIIRYLIDTYGYIPPRINRLVTGSYHSHRDTPPPPPPQPQYMDTAAAAAASNHQRIDNANQAALEAEVATRVLNSALQSVVNSLSPIASPSLQQQQQQQHQQSPLLDFNALMSDPPSVLPRLDDVSPPSTSVLPPPSMSDNDFIDNIFDEINREAATLPPVAPTPPPTPPTPASPPHGRYVKRMKVPHKSMSTTTRNSGSDDDDETPRSKIKSILNDYCKNKFNTRTTAHKIIDIANSVAKNNIR